MNFFYPGISPMQAEQKLEEYIFNQGAHDFYLKDIPLTEDDRNTVVWIVKEYTRHAYSFDDYRHILLLFVMNGYILFQNDCCNNDLAELFLGNESHIPQHHTRRLVYLLVNLFMDFNIATFGKNCLSLKDIMSIIKKHAELG